MDNQAYLNLAKKYDLPDKIFLDQFCAPEKYYEYFEEQFSARQRKELTYLKIKADLIIENIQYRDSY